MFGRAQAPHRARDHIPGNSPQLPTGRRPLVCPLQKVTMLFQRANESCQTKSHFKSTLCKKHVHYSTFHLLIMLWTGDQSGRNLSVLEINGFCGYLNPRSPLECNSLGKNSFPVLLPPTHTPIIQKRVMTQHRTRMRQLLGLFTF